jgi:hypothetical protein
MSPVFWFLLGVLAGGSIGALTMALMATVPPEREPDLGASEDAYRIDWRKRALAAEQEAKDWKTIGLAWRKACLTHKAALKAVGYPERRAG